MRQPPDPLSTVSKVDQVVISIIPLFILGLVFKAFGPRLQRPGIGPGEMSLYEVVKYILFHDVTTAIVFAVTTRKMDPLKVYKWALYYFVVSVLVQTIVYWA